MATMGNIRYWRTRAKEAEKALLAAYKNDLPVGTVVGYTHGKSLIEVEILEHSWHYPLVRNTKTGRVYRIAWDRFESIREE